MPEYPYTEPKQERKANAESICPKCFHRDVCRGTANQPCIRCSCFSPNVRPVVSGEWLFDDFDGDGLDYQCSHCKLHSRNDYDFCPNCGADMALNL